MANQQRRKRQKRYDPGSAYAGDVRPTGVLGFLGSSLTIRIVFIGMALALAAGGLAVVFGGDVLSGRTGNDNPEGFVLPEDGEGEDGTPTGPEQVEVRQYNAPPEMAIDTSKTYTATIATEAGEIEVELLDDEAPITVNNFVFLARDGFYDGLVFHYVTPGFSAQTGDPACTGLGDVCRGTGGPGYELSAEEGAESVGEGTLSMANASQFFIALTDSEQFANYAAFARILSGQDVAESLATGTQIQSIEITES